ncbi:uncharacterized protein K460DRAFT_266098, partial [Cucurbitaria berberidis CBS 394.84]
ISPTRINDPRISTPASPHPSVRTQIPLYGTVPQLQYSRTQALPTGHPPRPNAEAWHLMTLASSHLNLFLSKQMPLPSTAWAHVQSTVPLRVPHMRSQPQRESQGGEAHTPLMQSFPAPHWLPQRPQWLRSFLVSRQPPSQNSTPGPPQRGGVGVGVAEV